MILPGNDSTHVPWVKYFGGKRTVPLVVAAVMAGWSRMLPTVVDTILRALAPAMPDRIPAAHLGTLGGSITFFGNDPRTGRDFILQTIAGGGWGGW